MSIDPPTSPRPVPQQSKSSIPFLLNRPQSPLELYLPAPPRYQWSQPAEVIHVQIDDVDEVHPAGQTSWLDDIKSRESDNEDDEESGYMYESDVAQPPNLPPISSILFSPDPSIGSPKSSPMCSPRGSSATSSSSTAQFGGVTSSESSSSSSPLGWLNGPVEDAFSSPRWTSTATFSPRPTAGGAQQYAHSPREPAVATAPRSEQLQESSGYVFHSSPHSQAAGGTTHQQQAWASWTQNGASRSFRTQPTSATTGYYPLAPLVSAPISRNPSSGDTAESPSSRSGRGTSPAAMLSSFRQGAISHSAPSLLPGQQSQQHPNQNNHHQNMHANMGKVNSTNSNGSSATSSPRGLASLRQGAISVSSPSLLSSVGGAQSALAAPAFPSSLRGDKLHPQWVMTESRNHSPSMTQSSPHSSPNPDSAHGDPLGKRKRGRGSPGASAGGDFTFLHLQVGNDGRLTMVKELN